MVAVDVDTDADVDADVDGRKQKRRLLSQTLALQTLNPAFALVVAAA